MQSIIISRSEVASGGFALIVFLYVFPSGMTTTERAQHRQSEREREQGDYYYLPRIMSSSCRVVVDFIR
eukprot:scaffold1962_cov180-Ochromonas_danica.AAC.15